MMKKYIMAISIGAGLSANAASFGDENVQAAAHVAVTALSQKLKSSSIESEFSIRFEYEVSCEDDQPILFQFDGNHRTCLVRVGSRSLELLSAECIP
jgi:hypothetical protein